jgi:hypothetical protein
MPATGKPDPMPFIFTLSTFQRDIKFSRRVEMQAEAPVSMQMLSESEPN